MASVSLGVSVPTCYYPNGIASSEGDIPCNGNGNNVPCCPLNWDCTETGLCHLSNENYLGRYTCTDPDWGAGCPDICTHNNTANGNEAVLDCGSSSYCCDTNRPDLTNPNKACCKTTNSFFSLDSRMSMIPLGSSSSSSSSPSTTVVTLSSGVPSVVSGPFITLTGQSFSVSGGSSYTTSPSLISGTSGPNQKTVSSSITVSTPSGSAAPVAATSLPPVAQNSSGGKNLGAIIAPAVIVPLAVIAIALALFVFLRRRRGPLTETSTYPSGFAAEPKYEGPISPHSPYTSVNKSQLEGLSPDLATNSSSPATAQTGTSRFESPKIQGTSLSAETPSTGVLGGSRLSQMSSIDQPQRVEIAAEPVRSS